MIISTVFGPAASGKTRRMCKAHQLSHKYGLSSAMLTPYNPEPGAAQGFVSREPNPPRLHVPVIGADPLPTPAGLKILYVDNAQYLAEDELNWLLKHYRNCDWMVFFARRYRSCDIQGLEEFPVFQTLMNASNLPEQMLGTCRYCKRRAHYLHPVRGKRNRVNFICTRCLDVRGREELKLTV